MRCINWDHFVVEVIRYSKIANWLLFLNAKTEFGIWYIIAWLSVINSIMDYSCIPALWWRIQNNINKEQRAIQLNFEVSKERIGLQKWRICKCIYGWNYILRVLEWQMDLHIKSICWYFVEVHIQQYVLF